MNSFRHWLAPFLLLFCVSASALTDLDYLPKDVEYDPAIPLPETVLGTPVGEWHVRHDQLADYLNVLTEASPRVSLTEIGRSHENRPLLLLAFTSADNQQNLSAIQQRHAEIVKSGRKPPADAPLVIWMGYGVHGDEASTSNAAILVAYYLAAAQGPKIDALLNDNIVLLDPALNPDGISRFAHWANMHRGQTLVSDPNHREHVQAWPSARTNYYWFDLNRDWLLLTHPESRARVAQFQAWRPHVLTDFHEMGTNSTYFFQPGIPSRKNPWTPDKNVELTEALAKFHASALDEDKQLYFTQETFDDFYFGKGSTYPDAHGSIGILFEQASSRGHLQRSVNGLLSFPETIKNQVTTSLSTFDGALANRQALLDYQEEFYQQTQELIKDDNLRGYLLTEEQDPTRFEALKAIFRQHQIVFRSLSKEVTHDNRTYDPTKSIFVPLDQPQYRLIKSMFSTRTRFNDNTFYDVSNWNLPLAFNLEYVAVERNLFRKLDTQDATESESRARSGNLAADAYAYAFSWQDYSAPKLLQALLSNKVQVRISGEAFAATTSQGQVSFIPGSVVIPMALEQPSNLLPLIQSLSTQLNIDVWQVDTGLTLQGIDLGSRNMRAVRLPKVLLVGGRGTSQYEVGEAWHYLDRHVGMPTTLVELDRLERTRLAGYTHMIFVNGNYANVSEALTQKIEAWVKAGGVLIGQKGASRWFSDNDWLKASFMKPKDIEKSFSSEGLTYAEKEAFDAKQRIAGAVFESKLDTSHPLGFGYSRDLVPVFRNSDLVMLKPDQPFVTVAHYTDQPLLAGYTSDELEKLIAGSASAVAHRLGRGKVIAFTDNLNFRGYWYGTSRLLSNAIFMSGFINVQG